MTDVSSNPAFASAATAAIPASPASESSPSSAMTQSAFDRLGLQGSEQYKRNTQQMALTPYEYGLDPGGINPRTTQPANPTTQDSHPSAQRLSSAAWGGKTSQLNHAQAAEDQAPVWVTVPVDKVTTRGSVSNVNAVYASPQGYIPRPGNSGGSIPPYPPAGRPIPGNRGQGQAW